MLGSLRFSCHMFNKSGSVMHVLWWGVKAPPIFKYLKNAIERLQVVSGKIGLPVEGKTSGKAWSTRSKMMLVVRGEGQQGALILFWMKLYRLIDFFFFFLFFLVLRLKQLSKMVPWLLWKGERCCLLKVGLMSKCMWLVEVRQFIPI